MRCDLLQAVALCCHANRYLVNPDDAPAPELTISNHTFGSVYEAVWERVLTHGPLTVAEGTAPWYRKLVHDHSERLRLMAAGYAYHGNPRPGAWGILTETDLGLELWKPFWKPRGAHYDDPRPWKVVYTAERFSRYATASAPRLDASVHELQHATGELAEFLGSHGWSIARNFDDARRVFGAHGDQKTGFDDVLALDEPPELRAAAALAERCYMELHAEAWREVRPEDDGLRATITGRCVTVWACLLRTFEAVVNASGIDQAMAA